MFPASQAFILFCVVVNVVLSILDSVQGYHDDPNWQSWYRFLEPLTVGIFTVEYLIRLYAIGAHATYRHKGLYGRLQWAVLEAWPQRMLRPTTLKPASPW